MPVLLNVTNHGLNKSYKGICYSVSKETTQFTNYSMLLDNINTKTVRILKAYVKNLIILFFSDLIHMSLKEFFQTQQVIKPICLFFALYNELLYSLIRFLVPANSFLQEVSPPCKHLDVKKIFPYIFQLQSHNQ